MAAIIPDTGHPRVPPAFTLRARTNGELVELIKCIDDTLASNHRSLLAIDRKRSWRESEKAMAAGAIKQRMRCLQNLVGAARTALAGENPVDDAGFNAGTIAALAVLHGFDAETQWCEVLRTAGPDKVLLHALTHEGDWEWGGFKKYAARNFPKEVRAARAAAKQREAA